MQCTPGWPWLELRWETTLFFYYLKKKKNKKEKAYVEVRQQPSEVRSQFSLSIFMWVLGIKSGHHPDATSYLLSHFPGSPGLNLEHIDSASWPVFSRAPPSRSGIIDTCFLQEYEESELRSFWCGASAVPAEPSPWPLKPATYSVNFSVGIAQPEGLRKIPSH